MQLSGHQRLHIRVLGEASVEHDGTTVAIGSPKQRAMLAALALGEGHPVDVDLLSGLLWEEGQTPANPVGGLQVYVSGLRRLVEPPRAPRGRPQVVLTGPGGYSLSRELTSIDAVEVQEVATRVRRLLRQAPGSVVPVVEAPAADVAASIDEIDATLLRWRGEPYVDLVPTIAVVAARTRLESARDSLVESRTVAQLALRRDAEAADALASWVLEHPYDERMWCLYAVALARSERQAEALEALRTVRHQLDEELGVEPGPALRELETLVLRQDPRLHPAVPEQVRTARPAPAPVTLAQQPRPRADAAVVGRSRELDLLGDELAADGLRLVQVVGGAGIGKSTLVGELTDRARHAGRTVAVARCPEDEGAPPLWPWTSVLATLAEQGLLDGSEVPALLSETGTPSLLRDGAETAEVARFRLFQQLEAALLEAAKRTPCVVVLDDLHDADPSTLRFVTHLATTTARIARTGDLLVVLTRRPDEDLSRAGLTGALHALARHGGLRLDLEGLSPSDVATLARHRAAWSVDDDTAQSLHARTAGNPFMLVELLRLGEDAIRSGRVPAAVADVLRERLARLDRATRTALEAAAVVGQDFDLGLLADSLGRDPDDVLDTLDPAVASGLVLDEGSDKLRFAHALTRDAVYAEVPASRRTRLHAAVADALERREARLGVWSAEVARHWLAAGPGHAARAWRAARDAGHDSARRFAIDEAAALLDDAVGMQAADPDATPDQRFALWEATCEMLRRVGRWERFLTRVDEAAAAAEALGEVEWTARFCVMPAEAGPWTPRPYGAHDATAIRRLRDCLEAMDAQDSALRCRVMMALGSELYFVTDSTRECAALVDEALAMAARIADDDLRGRVAQSAALVLWRDGNAPRRLELATQAVAAAEASGDRDRLQTAIGLRMSAALESGLTDLVSADVQRSSSLLQERPLVYPAVVLACLQVPWLAAQGRFDEAERRFAAAGRLALGSELPWAALALGSARIGLGLWRGELDHPDDVLQQALDHSVLSIPTLRLLVAVRTGRLEEVASFLADHGGALDTEDFVTMFNRALQAEAAFLLGAPEHAAAAYAALAPHAGQVVSLGTGVPLGPHDAFLALAAATVGDRETATRHATDAEVLIERWELTACRAWFDGHRRAGGW